MEGEREGRTRKTSRMISFRLARCSSSREGKEMFTWKGSKEVFLRSTVVVAEERAKMARLVSFDLFPKPFDQSSTTKTALEREQGYVRSRE